MRLRDAIWIFVVVVLGVFITFLLIERRGPEKQGQWKATVGGVEILYQIVIPKELPPIYAAQAHIQVNDRFCRVYVDARVLTQGMPYFTYILAHETGHCVKTLRDRNEEIQRRAFVWGKSTVGCKFGAYFCDPEEGYAETWAHLYLERCGYNVATFNWPETKDKPCAYTPSWGAATPQRAEKMPLPLPPAPAVTSWR